MRTREAENDSGYTRQRAIEDGQLIDLTAWATRSGIMAGLAPPIAITATAWRRVVPQRGRSTATADRVERLLRSASSAVFESLPLLGRIPFDVRLGRRRVPLVVAFHESDAAERVATIMIQGKRCAVDAHRERR